LSAPRPAAIARCRPAPHRPDVFTPEVIEVMAELGVDLAGRVEQLVSELDRATAGAGGSD
jgi:hypothetical protein